MWQFIHSSILKNWVIPIVLRNDLLEETWDHSVIYCWQLAFSTALVVTKRNIILAMKPLQVSWVSSSLQFNGAKVSGRPEFHCWFIVFEAIVWGQMLIHWLKHWLWTRCPEGNSDTLFSNSSNHWSILLSSLVLMKTTQYPQCSKLLYPTISYVLIYTVMENL